MKRFYLATLLLVLLLCNGSVFAQLSPLTCTFPNPLAGYTTYTVPNGVFSVTVDMYGGKAGTSNCSGTGGNGGRVQCTLSTLPGQVLNIYVGGGAPNYVCCPTNPGGYNGGGTGYQYGAGGGGASDIRIGGTGLGNRVVVAGGGGGAGYNWCSEVGGPGGGLIGGTGYAYSGNPSNYYGMGGTQIAGGAGATYSGTSQSGSLGQGGGVTNGYGGGGGGGGYYGGGSGDNYTPGGGGSSYTNAALCSGVVHTQGYAAANGNGQVVITPICTSPVAGVISGTSALCVGKNTLLTDSKNYIDGVWSSRDISIAIVSTTGLVTAVSPGTATITFETIRACGSPADDYFTMTVNPVPSISGSTGICTVVPGLLTASVPGGVWTSSNIGVAAVGASSGIATGSTAGLTNVTYSVTATGCSNSTAVSVFNSPVAITGTLSVCQGQTTTLTDGTSGGSWSSSNTAVAVVNPISGVVSGVAAGNAVITYTMPVGGCTATAVVTVNPTPNAYAVTAPGGNHYCSGGTGVLIGLSGSDGGINYQVFDGGAAGAAIAGPGGSFNFGAQTGVGPFTVIATDATTGCANTMTGSQAVTIDALPGIQSVTLPDGTSNYCAGGSGVHVGLSGSSSTVNYTLFMGGIPVYSVSGSGSPLNFGMYAAGTYTVQAADATTGCKQNMSGNAVVSANPLPDNTYAVTVTNGGNYCTGGAGQRIGLTYSVSGVNYQLMWNGTPVPLANQAGVNGPLDFGLRSTNGFYTIVATNATTNCSATMTGGATITALPLPLDYAVTAPSGNSYCATGTGVPVNMGNSANGVAYKLYNGSIPVPGANITSTGGSFSFGNMTAAGTYSVLATDPGTGCSAAMTTTQTVVVNPLPAAYSVNAPSGTNYCTGGTGLPIGLDTTAIGISYQLHYLSGTASSWINGTGGSLVLGTETGAGAYTVVGKDNATGCTNDMAGSTTITIIPLPTVYNVTAPTGSSYCSGGIGVHVGLSYSDAGVYYKLYNSTFVVDSFSGTAGTLDFGFRPAGTYSVVATNGTTGCTSNMSGVVNVTTNLLPPAQTLSGGGSFCAGGAPHNIILHGSNYGISYQLLNGTVPVGSLVSGSGAPIDFGNFTAPGNYTVLATNLSTTCANNMSGTVNVSVSTPPAAQTVSGGGAYCAGGLGDSVGLANSEAGVTYKLYNGSTLAGTVTGTGADVSFGRIAGVGTYTVTAANTAGCSSPMSGSVVIAINPAPNVFTVTGGASLCAGSSTPVGLSGSSTGTSYQLYNSTTGLVSTLGGTNLGLDFGPQSMGGTYTIMARNNITGCTANMASGAVINIIPTPATYMVAGGGPYCATGIGPHIGIMTSDRGTDYQLYNSTTGAVGRPWHGTGSTIDFGTYAVPGTYTVIANTAGTACSATMSSAAIVSTSPAVTAGAAVTDSVSHKACSGNSVTFFSVPANAGTTPGYQWSVGGVAVAGATDSSYVYAPHNGDVVAVTLTLHGTSTYCPTSSSVNGHEIITIDTSIAPTVTVAADHSYTVCGGTTVQFNAYPTYGGTAPSYTWKVGSTTIGHGPAITYIPTNGQVVFCNMVSNYACQLGTGATSTGIPFTIATPPAPVFTIAGRTSIGLNEYDSLSANITANGGTTPSYQWYINGTAVASAHSNMFVYNNFNNRDSVSCRVIGSGMCGGDSTWHSVLMNVRNLGVSTMNANSSFAVVPNPNKGIFTLKGSLSAGSSDDLTVEVTNMLGQVVYKGQVRANNGNVDEHIQLSNIANGMYLLNVHSETENAVFHVVVEK